MSIRAGKDRGSFFSGVGHSKAGDRVSITELAILLMGVALGWLILFAVRRNRVQWGAFATFLTVILGSGLLKFLYATELLSWYGIGLFIGFAGNTVTRALGIVIGGRAGEGLLEIAAFTPRDEGSADDAGRGPEGEGPA